MSNALISDDESKHWMWNWLETLRIWALLIPIVIIWVLIILPLVFLVIGSVLLTGAIADLFDPKMPNRLIRRQ